MCLKAVFPSTLKNGIEIIAVKIIDITRHFFRNKKRIFIKDIILFLMLYKITNKYACAKTSNIINSSSTILLIFLIIPLSISVPSTVA